MKWIVIYVIPNLNSASDFKAHLSMVGLKFNDVNKRGPRLLHFLCKYSGQVDVIYYYAQHTEAHAKMGTIMQTFGT